MVNTNNLKKGLILKLEGTLFEVLEYQHYKPGKGPAFVRAKLRNVHTGSIIDKKLPAGEKVEDVFVEKKTMVYSYQDGGDYVFMDTETYEQEAIKREIIESQIPYLTENLEVVVKFYEGQVMGVDLPAHVTLEVLYAEPGVKGDTATSAFKVVEVETGLSISVPLFIKTGNKIRVDTRTGDYVERA